MMIFERRLVGALGEATRVRRQNLGVCSAVRNPEMAMESEHLRCKLTVIVG